MVVGRELSGLPVEHRRLIVAALVGEGIAAPGQLIGAVQLIEPPQLDERIRMVLDPERDARLPPFALRRHDQQRGRLTATDIAAGCLGRVERCKQAAGQRAGRRRKGPQHARPDARVGHDVCLAGDLIAGHVAGEGHAGGAGVRGHRAACVDDRDLAPGGAGVRRRQPRKHVPRADPGCEQLERLGPVGPAHVCLGRHGTDTGARPGHLRPDTEPVRLHGDAKLTGLRVACDDRIGHAPIVRTRPGRTSRLGERAGGTGAIDGADREQVCREQSARRPLREAIADEVPMQ